MNIETANYSTRIEYCISELKDRLSTASLYNSNRSLSKLVECNSYLSSIEKLLTEVETEVYQPYEDAYRYLSYDKAYVMGVPSFVSFSDLLNKYNFKASGLRYYLESLVAQGKLYFNKEKDSYAINVNYK